MNGQLSGPTPRGIRPKLKGGDLMRRPTRSRSRSRGRGRSRGRRRTSKAKRRSVRPLRVGYRF